MKENDIRPFPLFNEYLMAAREDCRLFFADSSQFQAIPCVACGEDRPLPRFVKDGFQYVECGICCTLYVSPRPSVEAYRRFYRDSQSTKFWADRFYRETEGARREHLFRPRALEVRHVAERFLGNISPSVVDVGCGYGTFMEELARLDFFGRIEGIDPSSALASVARGKGMSVQEKAVEEIEGEGNFDIVTSFELFEHVHAPLDFLKAVRRRLNPGGLLYMTTLSHRGFDILLLGDASKSVSPPHHINFITPDSLVTVLERSGFEPLSIETPGRLDVEIVRNHGWGTTVSCDEFTRTVLFECEDYVRTAFQKFLSENKLSSHIRAVARREDVPLPAK